METWLAFMSQYLTYRSIPEVWVTSFKLSSKLQLWICDFLRLSVNCDLKKGASPWFITYIDFIHTTLNCWAMLLSGNIDTKVPLKWSFEWTENPLMADFSVQIISAFVEAVSVLHDDSVVCCHLEVGTWLSDSNSAASAPSTVVCLTERDFLKKLRTFFKASSCFWPLPWSTTAD